MQRLQQIIDSGEYMAPLVSRFGVIDLRQYSPLPVEEPSSFTFSQFEILDGEWPIEDLSSYHVWALRVQLEHTLRALNSIQLDDTQISQLRAAANSGASSSDEEKSSVRTQEPLSAETISGLLQFDHSLFEREIEACVESADGRPSEQLASLLAINFELSRAVIYWLNAHWSVPSKLKHACTDIRLRLAM